MLDTIPYKVFDDTVSSLISSFHLIPASGIGHPKVITLGHLFSANNMHGCFRFDMEVINMVKQDLGITREIYKIPFMTRCNPLPTNSPSFTDMYVDAPFKTRLISILESYPEASQNT